MKAYELLELCPTQFMILTEKFRKIIWTLLNNSQHVDKFFSALAAPIN